MVGAAASAPEGLLIAAPAAALWRLELLEQALDTVSDAVTISFLATASPDGAQAPICLYRNAAAEANALLAASHALATHAAADGGTAATLDEYRASASSDELVHSDVMFPVSSTSTMTTAPKDHHHDAPPMATVTATAAAEQSVAADANVPFNQFSIGVDDTAGSLAGSGCGDGEGAQVNPLARVRIVTSSSVSPLRNPAVRAVLDACPLASFVELPDISLEWTSGAVAEAAGAMGGSPQLAGHGWIDTVHPDDLSAALAAERTAQETGTFPPLEVRLAGAPCQKAHAQHREEFAAAAEVHGPSSASAASVQASLSPSASEDAPTSLAIAASRIGAAGVTEPASRAATAAVNGAGASDTTTSSAAARHLDAASAQLAPAQLGAATTSSSVHTAATATSQRATSPPAPAPAPTYSGHVDEAAASAAAAVEWCYYAVYLKAVRHPVTGAVMRWIGMMRDINDQKRLEQKLEEEKALFITAMDQLPVALFVADAPSGKVRLVNRQASVIWRKPMAAATFADYGPLEAYHVADGGRRYAMEDWPMYRSLYLGETVTNEDAIIVRG